MRRLNYKKIYSKIFQSIDLRTIEEREVFVSLILASDLHGRFHGEPEIVRGVCFPLVESMTISKVKTAMDSLAQLGMIKYYENTGKKYLMIVNHEEYNPTKDRGAGKSIFPIPADFIDVNNSEELQSSPKLSKVIKSKSELLSSDFEECWAAYPRKEGKAQALKHWNAHPRSKEDMLKAISNYEKDLNKRYFDPIERKKFTQTAGRFFFESWEDWIETEEDRKKKAEDERQKRLAKEMEDKKAKFLAEHPEYKKEEDK